MIISKAPWGPALFYLLTCLFWGACSDSTTAAGEGAADSSEDTPAKSAASRDSQTKAGGGSLSQGKFTVLGLRVPQGMEPGKAPQKVYRFEGIIPVKQVSEFMQNQVRALWVKEEGSGYLIREARVKNPAGGASGEDLLSLRIFRGRKGGATLDVWLEKPKQAAGTTASAKSSGGLGMTAAQRERRRTAINETMRVMQKVAKGEELDEKDYESQFFQ